MAAGIECLVIQGPRRERCPENDTDGAQTLRTINK